MVILTCILACAGLLADAKTTREGILWGHGELNPVRAFFVKLFGINGGTYGVAIAACVVDVAVSLMSRQPEWGLAVGNAGIALLCWVAFFRNAEAI